MELVGVKPEELAKRLDPSALKAARITMLRRMLAIGQRNVQKRTPVKRGNLRRTITSREDVPGERGVIGTNANYAKPVHEGTRPHIIRPRTAKSLHWTGAQHPVKSVRHPGIKGQPFLVEGLKDSKAEFDNEAAAAGEAFFSSIAK